MYNICEYGYIQLLFCSFVGMYYTSIENNTKFKKNRRVNSCIAYETVNLCKKGIFVSNYFNLLHTTLNTKLRLKSYRFKIFSQNIFKQPQLKCKR